jgi:hypothetical protein
MTTSTNGGDHGRIVDRVEGIVQASNPRGLRLIGEQDYRNFSKYAQPPIAPPERGAHVILGLDSDGFVRELRVEPGVDTPPATSDPSRDHQIRRQVAAKVAGQLLAAAIQSREDARIEHFDQVADRVLRWLERGDASA